MILKVLHHFALRKTRMGMLEMADVKDIPGGQVISGWRPLNQIESNISDAEVCYLIDDLERDEMRYPINRLGLPVAEKPVQEIVDPGLPV